jgi:hypothetical protein
MVKRIGGDDMLETATATERENNLVAELAFAAAVTIGPFLTALCTELGKRFGGTAADWAARMRTRWAPGSPGAARIEVAAFGKVTIVEITEPLTDDAKLALLDLDIRDAAYCGRTLRWDPQSGAWQADPGGSRR